MKGTRSVFSDPVDPPPQGTPWTVLHLLRWSTDYLKEKGIGGGRLDVEHLLADILGMDRLQLYLHFDRPVSPEELDTFKPRLLDRARRKPLQYILGKTSFRELSLRTDPRALIPRPETEELVEAVLGRVQEWDGRALSALDIGTGSGAIALSLALEGPFERIVATDRSEDALALAQENARELGLQDRVTFRAGEGLEPLEAGERFSVVVSNPPYVTEEEFEVLEPEIRSWEPRDALVASEGGMSVLLELVEGAGSVLAPGGLLALEVGSGQAQGIAERIRSVSGFGAPAVLRDLSRRDRIVLASWEPPAPS